MPASLDPKTPSRNDVRVIEFQCGDCGAPGRCQADDSRSAVIPGEVIEPSLRAGVEEGRCRAGHRVLGRSLHPFEAVTPSTRQPQVRFFGWAAAGARNDVLNVHLRAADALVGQTVSATMTGVDRDPIAYVASDRLNHQAA